MYLRSRTWVCRAQPPRPAHGAGRPALRGPNFQRRIRNNESALISAAIGRHRVGGGLFGSAWVLEGWFGSAGEGSRVGAGQRGLRKVGVLAWLSGRQTRVFWPVGS